VKFTPKKLLVKAMHIERDLHKKKGEFYF